MTRIAPLDTPIGRIAGSVRYGFGALSISNATGLVEVLETSPRRARDLYFGRQPFTLRELAIVSAYFNVPITSWLNETPPMVGNRATGSDSALHADGLDRAMTMRETRYRVLGKGL